jgi:alkyl sulfatase BDS1-like metallo-beta-lactamase superfamily hydrolase
MGYTINELPDMVEMPEGLVAQWGTHGYYGSKSHNVRAVYNFYLGYFDGNPAHLNPLPNREIALKYVAALGGTEAVMKLGQEALEQQEYRWGAELVNHLVFAQPDNLQAKYLQADLLEQMGYQAENGTWRNFYLAGASELRNGVTRLKAPNTASLAIISNMTLDLVFGYMGIQLNAKKATGKNITINWVFPDTKENYTLFLENSVLNSWPNSTVNNADVTVDMYKSTLNLILTGDKTFQAAMKDGSVKLDGDPSKLFEVLSSLDNLNKSISFNIVTP